MKRTQQRNGPCLAVASGRHLVTVSMTLAVSCIFLSSHLQAATELGTVSDENGKPIARVHVTVSDPAQRRSVVAVTFTDDKGVFQCNALAAGTYRNERRGSHSRLNDAQ